MIRRQHTHTLPALSPLWCRESIFQMIQFPRKKSIPAHTQDKSIYQGYILTKLIFFDSFYIYINAEVISVSGIWHLSLESNLTALQKYLQRRCSICFKCIIFTNFSLTFGEHTQCLQINSTLCSLVKEPVFRIFFW